MQEELELLKKEISRIVRQIDNNDWLNAELIIQFPPVSNRSIKGLPSFSDSKGEKIRVFPDFDESFQKRLYSFFVKYNQQHSFNQVSFRTVRDKYEEAEMEISFNQQVEDNFQNSLPKSMRGKTLPWWKNPDETKGLA